MNHYSPMWRSERMLEEAIMRGDDSKSLRLMVYQPQKHYEDEKIGRDFKNPKEYTAKTVLEQPDWADQPNEEKYMNFVQEQEKESGDELVTGRDKDRLWEIRFLGSFKQSFIPSTINTSPVSFEEKKHKLFIKSYDEPPKKRPICPFHNRLLGYASSGITGRGILGKWGPNFAADPIILMNKKFTEKNIKELRDKVRLPEEVKQSLDEYKDKTNKSVLTVMRNDTSKFKGDLRDIALPGGMIDFHRGDDAQATITCKREFAEEVLCIMKFFEFKYVNQSDNPTGPKAEEKKEGDRDVALEIILNKIMMGENPFEQYDFTEVELTNGKKMNVMINNKDEFNRRMEFVIEIFKEGNEQFVCNAFVQDPRNTDNSWMETSVYLYDVDNIYEKNNKKTEKEKLDELITKISNDKKEKCDEGEAVWLPIELIHRFRGVLYASHSMFVKLALDKNGEKREQIVKEGYDVRMVTESNIVTEYERNHLSA